MSLPPLLVSMYHHGRRLHDNETVGEVFNAEVPSQVINTEDLIVMQIDHELAEFAPTRPLVLSSFDITFHWVNTNAAAQSYTTSATLATTAGELKRSVCDSGKVEPDSHFGFLVEGTDRPMWDNTIIMADIIDLDVIPLVPVHITLVSSTHLELTKGKFEIKFVSDEVLHPVYIDCTLNRPFEVIYNELFQQLRYLRAIADSAILKLYYGDTKIDVANGNLATAGLTDKTVRALNNVVVMRYSIREQWESGNHHGEEGNTDLFDVLQDDDQNEYENENEEINYSNMSHQLNHLDLAEQDDPQRKEIEDDTTLSPIVLDLCAFTSVRAPSPIDVVEGLDDEFQNDSTTDLPPSNQSQRWLETPSINNSLTNSLTSHDNEGRIISMYYLPSSTDLNPTDESIASNDSPMAPSLSDVLDYYDDSVSLEKTVSPTSDLLSPSDYFVSRDNLALESSFAPFKFSYNGVSLLLDLSDVIIVPGPEPYALISPKSAHKVMKFLHLQKLPRVERLQDSNRSMPSGSSSNLSFTDNNIANISEEASAGISESDARSSIQSNTTADTPTPIEPPVLEEVVEVPVQAPLNQLPAQDAPEVINVANNLRFRRNVAQIIVDGARHVFTGIFGFALILYTYGPFIALSTRTLIIIHVVYLILHISSYATRFIEPLETNFGHRSRIWKALLIYLKVINAVTNAPSTLGRPLLRIAMRGNYDFELVMNKIQGNQFKHFGQKLRDAFCNSMLFFLLMFSALEYDIIIETNLRKDAEFHALAWKVKELTENSKWKSAVEKKQLYKVLVDYCESVRNDDVEEINGPSTESYSFLLGCLILYTGILNPADKPIEDWIEMVGYVDQELGEHLLALKSKALDNHRAAEKVEESELLSREDTHATGAQSRHLMLEETDDGL